MPIIENFPMPISSNKMYTSSYIKGKTRAGKSMRKSGDYLAYEKICEGWAYQHKAELKKAQEGSLKRLDDVGIIYMDIRFYFHSTRCYSKKGNNIKKHDVFNFIKPLHDQLCNLLGFDDRYIWGGSVEKLTVPIEEDEYVFIRIR